jgi:molecular chaperone GrpE
MQDNPNNATAAGTQSPEPDVAPSLREPAAAPTTEGQVDTPPSSEELLRQAELKAAEYYDAWLRAKAEMENVRRRAQEDVVKAHKFGIEKFAQAMLPVKDSLEATLLAESATLESLKAGVELTLKQLVTGMEAAGITEVNPLGDKFDPHHHQAISTIESEGEANRVLTVLQKGYLLKDRVLRPALVIVSKEKPEASSSST